ncbi:MAG: 3-hydroxyacyl-CoA dehydrogenase [Rhodospirillaceae bacterium]|nr:3-hydroxyacyl-CoA dehydrogenase [Rhodospirillaceae bacterium]MBT5192000.1 3-hydroxyacyl-CoA dehydrogenase [Rhodospirillaceae bacterium]MBT6431388.1 3-hydroxyacyl-CoA dehydrogenase [Rhodospirillaceae bacterium]
MAGHIAIVGAGLVGGGWTIVFARAGEQVRVYDAAPAIRQGFMAVVGQQLDDLKSYELIDDVAAILARIIVCETLEEAVRGARFVQESVLEEVPVKREISNQIGPLLDPGAIVGSSTSGIPGSAFTEEATNRERFLVTHPVNPPYLVPVVEVVPAPWTARDAVDGALAIMAKVGQSPVLVRREIEGFILNRLQGVLLREAWDLFEAGYASAEDIDNTVSEGLGLRWSFMGPFETIDLNAPGGVADYAARLGPLYHSIQKSRTDPQMWSDGLIGKVDDERREVLPMDGLAGRRSWRDRRLMALAAHKAKQD